MTAAVVGATLLALFNAWEKYSNHKEMIEDFLRNQTTKTKKLIH